MCSNWNSDGYRVRPYCRRRVARGRGPCRTPAILLIGGDKTGNKRFYKKMIPVADRLYDEHIEELRKEGLIR